MPKILLADDEQEIRQTFKTFLSEAGFDVICACDGKEAVELFINNRPDLVILDVMMPFMDGFEAALEIRRLQGKSYIPIIFVSAFFGDTVSRIKALDIGGVDYLPQPVEVIELVSKVKAALRVKNLYDELLKENILLHEREDRFRQFFENEPEYCYMISPEGNIIDVNKSALIRLGYRREDLVGKPLNTIYSPESMERMKELFKQWKKTGVLLNEEMTIVTRKGERRAVLLSASSVKDENGRIIHSISVQRDITDRKKIQDALAASEERFRVMFESSHDLLSISDFNGYVMWANKAWHNILGYTPETYGDPVEKIHADDRSKIIHIWKTLADGGDEEIKTRYRYKSAAGDYLHLEALIRKLMVSGTPFIYTSARDITELVTLRRKMRIQEGFPGIIGRDPRMLEIFESIRELAEVDVPVMITGESGTGKELVAEAIHKNGPRADRNFVPVNCGALPDSLLESELFGHVRGAFTGAVRDKKGRFELADGGTIFLDEVGDISPAMQVKLLRVLQQGTFERVGGEKTIQVNVRLISATNKNLWEEVKKGRFREDLYYRISVVPVSLPPLRERMTDIPLLAQHIFEEKSREWDRRRDTNRKGKIAGISPKVLSIMMSYPWPGNVRELQNVLQYALIKSKGKTIRMDHLPPVFSGQERKQNVLRGRRKKLNSADVSEALKKTGGNKVKAARILGVSRATLYRFLGDQSWPERKL